MRCGQDGVNDDVGDTFYSWNRLEPTVLQETNDALANKVVMQHVDLFRSGQPCMCLGTL